jgi:nickel transport protein
MKQNPSAINLNICPIAIVCLVSLLFLMPSTASAHRVSIFAWVEGDTVHTESKFFGGKEVKHGHVKVTDTSGALLLEGQTDENGEFSFKAPVRAEMKITVSAGMGHQAHWTVKQSDFQATQTEAGTESNPLQSPPSASAPDLNNISPADAERSSLTALDIQQAVEKALDKKLTPVIKIISESYENSMRLSDILGGIGYIIGLVGLAAYINSRKQKDRQAE